MWLSTSPNASAVSSRSVACCHVILRISSFRVRMCIVIQVSDALGLSLEGAGTRLHMSCESAFSLSFRPISASL